MSERDPDAQPEQPGSETGQGSEERSGEELQSGNAGPAEDIESDPAYAPDDERLKRVKGG